MSRVLAIAAVMVLVETALIAGEFKVDPVHSSVNFSIKHMMVSNTKGSFGTFKGTWTLDDKNEKLTAFAGEVDVTSIDTNSKARDKHLRKDDFFHTKEHPKAQFEMLKHHGDRLIAKVTIRGVTKPVEFKIKMSDVVDHPMKKGVKMQGVTLTGTIKRLDFDVGKDYPNKVLSNAVEMTVELEGLAK